MFKSCNHGWVRWMATKSKTRFVALYLLLLKSTHPLSGLGMRYRVCLARRGKYSGRTKRLPSADPSTIVIILIRNTFDVWHLFEWRTRLTCDTLADHSWLDVPCARPSATRPNLYVLHDRGGEPAYRTDDQRQLKTWFPCNPSIQKLLLFLQKLPFVRKEAVATVSRYTGI